MKIAGCIIIYGENLDFLENIKSYIDDLDKLYVYDNNEKNTFLKNIPKYKKITYITEHKNNGIAYALNYCATLARKDGYHWLLTMDQDSKFQNSIRPMIKLAEKDNPDIALIVPKYNIGDFYKNKSLVAMTSGNLLNLDVHNKLDGFKEYFFIDLVDYEYCLNLRRNNYQIVDCKKTILKHNLGKIESKKVLGRRIYYTNHNSLRRYYITRNRLILNYLYKNDFPDFCKTELKYNRRELIKIVLFESQKIEKIKMYIKGYIDYRRWSREYEKK